PRFVHLFRHALEDTLEEKSHVGVKVDGNLCDVDNDDDPTFLQQLLIVP
ncbi:5500_t:CDS:1, partial [Paraglomus occultum]